MSDRDDLRDRLDDVTDELLSDGDGGFTAHTDFIEVTDDIGGDDGSLDQAQMLDATAPDGTSSAKL